ncbi:hypothetical protein EDD11_003412 [Mortierella claussenii]|nr:hypothetical protein EDD11_003412 [Mortierella claussenii]
MELLEGIRDHLDNAKNCLELPPTLDQLVMISGQHREAWEPFFKAIVDLLVGWHIDRATSDAVRKRIADALSSFSVQWCDAADFAQDILEYFINDLDTIATDTSANDLPASINTARLLMRSFDIIAKALISHAMQLLDRFRHIQQSAVDMLSHMARLSRDLDGAGNEIILTLSLGNVTTFYDLQPKAVLYLTAQFEDAQIGKAAWSQKIFAVKKILMAWKPSLHPTVTLEITHPKGDLMRLRWLLSTDSRRRQDTLDIILLSLPGSTNIQLVKDEEFTDVRLLTWSGIMHELDSILQSSDQGTSLSESLDFSPVMEDDGVSKIDHIPHSRFMGTQCHGGCQEDDRCITSSISARLSNATFDTLLLVELARLWPSEAGTIFLRLLRTLKFTPEVRSVAVVYGLREIAASCHFFVPAWLDKQLRQASEADGLDKTTLGMSLKTIQGFVAIWKALLPSIKLCIVAWKTGILRAMQPFKEDASHTWAWSALKKALSSDMHQLITIAGADEDDLMRGSIASVFEGFIGTFGSFNLGPEFFATMTDRSLDISPVVRNAWRTVIMQSNPFVFAFECYDLPETDITRVLKILVLRSPNSGIFRYPHFSTVLSSLEPADFNYERSNKGIYVEQDGDMLQRLFYSCQGKEIMTKVNAELGTDMIAPEQVETFQHSLNLLTYWSLWETARYCVLSRLRTPFGGPQQTLDSLEKQLNSLLSSDQKDANPHSRLTHLRDFLMFLDRLELQFYNAHHGTALGVIPLSPKPSIVFVRSNKKMWDEWLNRIRSRIIEGAKTAGEHELVIRNGYMVCWYMSGSCAASLQSIHKIDGVYNFAVVESLIATKASDAISGLYVWCRRAIKDMTKQSSSSRSKSSRSERSTQYPRYRNACLNEGQAAALSQISLDWMNTAVSYAQSRYEQSSKDAMLVMGSLVDDSTVNDPTAPEEFLCQEISNSLSDLYSYRQLQTFMDSNPLDVMASQTMLWSDDTLNNSLKQYCDNEALEAWKSLEGFYEARGRDLLVPDVYTFDRCGIVGRNFLFAAKVHQQSGQPLAELDQLRQQAFLAAQPCAEFLSYNGLKHASAILIDAMMLNTPAAVTPLMVKEFMEQLSLIPDELKMNLFHKDLRYWVRLDSLVNLAKRQALNGEVLVRKQSNEFKFLLSKIARRSECHDFASNIPRTWEGTLSPEIQLEEAKAAMAKHDYTTALNASSRILNNISNLLQTGGDQSMTVFKSKIYLKMAKWSRSTKPRLSEAHLEAFEDILSLQHEGAESPQARVELITSACLNKAIEIGYNYRKSWFAFGTHHYKQGWGILDELGSFRFHHPVAVAANETLKNILERVNVDNAEEQSKNTFCVFVKHCASGQPFDESAAYETIRTHLLKIDQVAESEGAIAEIIDSFQMLLKRILESYRLAIHGYFRFLQFTALEFECSQPKSKTTSGEEAEVQVSQSAVSDEITATLRLLRLLAKHGGQLYDTFHENLVDINVSPWTNIIPQLFARLDHPEKPVQTLIVDVLCKIGERYPQLIVFHCVVGANSSHNSPCQRRLLRTIGDYLSRSHHELVVQVQHLIRELERVTVLWEEVWYKKIMMSLPELKSTLHELTEQYQGLEAIAGLGPEDKNAVMSDNYQQSIIPLLATFESLQDAHAYPESNHERWFISTFRDRIQAALDCLRSPKVWTNLFEGLAMLKEVYMDLGKELSRTRILQLSNLSPELASIQSSLIDIPSPNQDAGITIQSFEQQVVVIPTKTKPKKLTLLGSDGKRYTFLFKGLEDLHLDERVMQLLRISNGMLQRDKDSNLRQLSAQHYAVVPLSDNSGMIQWVENTVSIFTIIAKWQHRELMCSRWMNDDNATGPPQQPQRATEVYHEKAMAALKRAGLPSTHPRRQWPKSILLDLYHDMANDTPADLLERELWSSSPTPAEWWRKSVRFARSTAVMSMIGYVIGLGDRHLDNILIDFTTGDLVHIDYNVCFEKGKRLRIPEIVPFRLSRNMLTSLGVTGVEGNFRIGCEQTMKVMRKNKEILVTLLEAFVYDPLVDWQIEATTAQGGVGGHGAATGVGHDVGQGPVTDSLQSLALESESENSSVSMGNYSRDRDSRSSFETNASVRSHSMRRRLSNESFGSMRSVSGISVRSTATIESARRWNNTVGDPLDSTLTSATLSFVNGTDGHHEHFQQQEQQQQQSEQESQQPVHQRNAYAVNILRRVRHKLEGRDFEAMKKCKVTEQVDRVIQEATNVENLANMYEGWTPWL